MKKGIALTAVLILFSALSFGVSAQSNADKTMTKKEVKKWFAKQEWLGGVQLKPHKSVDLRGSTNSIKNIGMKLLHL